ncbi:MAG: efflux RND transporter periplasmic adaptor subunit, partial [Chloroflexota bacterium]
FALLALGVPFAFFALQAFGPPQQGGASGGRGGGGGSDENFSFFVVETGEVEAVVSAVGEIEADETVDISYTTGGRIAEVFVKETDYILEGDLLMRLENNNQRIAYDQAVLNLELAELELADLTAPVDADDIRIAEANVAAAEGNLRGSYGTASQAEIRAAELQVQQAEDRLETTVDRRIIGGQFDSDEEVELADAQIGEASFNLRIAQLQLEDLRTGDFAAANAAALGVEQALAELEQVLAGPTDLEIEQAEVRVEQAMAGLETAETTLSKSEIRAPFDGFVSLVNVEPGTLVIAGEAVAQMVDVDPLSVTVQIDEIDIGLIEPGMRANVEVDALQDLLLPARLASVALVGTQTSGGIVNYDAEIELNDINPLVRVGMTAEANIIVNEELNVVRVPNAYVRLDRRNNEAFVQVQNTETNEFEEREVTLGLRGEDFSQVADGLVVGDIIRADLSGNQFELFGG